MSSETALPGGITIKPGEATILEEDDDGNGGGGGLFGALGGIAEGATSRIGEAIEGIKSVTTGALALAGGTTGAATGLSGSLPDAIGLVYRSVAE